MTGGGQVSFDLGHVSGMLARIGVVAKQDTSEGGYEVELTANGPYGFNSDFKARIGRDNLRRLSEIFAFLAEQL